MIIFPAMMFIWLANGVTGMTIKSNQLPADLCSNPGRLHQDPANCRKFYRCINGKPISMACPHKTAFDPDTQICVWRDNLISCTAEPTSSEVVSVTHKPDSSQKRESSISTSKPEPKILAQQKTEVLQVANSATVAPSQIWSRNLKLNPTKLLESNDAKLDKNKILPAPSSPITKTRNDFNFVNINNKNDNTLATMETTEMPVHRATQNSNSLLTKVAQLYQKMAGDATVGNSPGKSKPNQLLDMSSSNTQLGADNLDESEDDNIEESDEGLLFESEDAADSEAILLSPYSADVGNKSSSPASLKNASALPESNRAGRFENSRNISVNTTSKTSPRKDEHIEPLLSAAASNVPNGETQESVNSEVHLNNEVINETLSMGENVTLSIDNHKESNIIDINLDDHLDTTKPEGPANTSAVLITTDFPGTTDNNDKEDNFTSLNYPNEKLITQEMLLGSSLPSQDNDSLSYDDLATLIQPFRARIGSRQDFVVGDQTQTLTLFNHSSEIPEQDHNTDNSLTIPAELKHLTAKIVDINRLTPSIKVKPEPKWYDPEFKDSQPHAKTSSPLISTDVTTQNLPVFTSRGSTSELNNPTITIAESSLVSVSTPIPDSSIDFYSVEVNNELPEPASDKTAYTVHTSLDSVSRTEDDASNVKLMSVPYRLADLFQLFHCPEPDGNFPDPKNCSVYYFCNGGQPARRECSPDQRFDPRVRTCVSAILAPPCSTTYMGDLTEEEFFARSICKESNGLYRDELSCLHYFECTEGWPIRRKCLVGSRFDAVKGKCSWSQMVPGCEERQSAGAEMGITGPGHISWPCPKDGYFRDADRCDVYYMCADGRALRMTCDPGTSFDATLNMCMWSNLVAGCVDQEVSPGQEIIRDDRMVKSQNDVSRADSIARAWTVKTTDHLGKTFTCPKPHGLYPDPRDCSFFIHCFKKVAYRHQCQKGTVFSSENAACTWSDLVPECKNQATQEEELKVEKAPEVKQQEQDKLIKVQLMEQNKLPENQFKEHNVLPESQFKEQNKLERENVAMEVYQPKFSHESPKSRMKVSGTQEFVCPSSVIDGFHQDNHFCDVFHRCVLGTKFTFTCPAGTFFRASDKLCDFYGTVPDCTPDGVRIATLSGQSNGQQDLVTSRPALEPPQSETDQLEVNVINLDADPVLCPGSDGLYPHPRSCSQFLFCSKSFPLVLTCPDSLLYNAETLTCDYAPKVRCLTPNYD